MTRERIDGKLIEAALEFYRHEEEIRRLRKLVRRCSEYEPHDHECGYAGNPECEDSDAALSDYCDNWKARLANRPVYLAACKGRSAAKRKMLRWAALADKIKIEEIR